MLGLNETMDQMAMTNCVCWYGSVLRKQECHILRSALDFEVEGQWKKGRLKKIWKMQVEEESMRREDALC